MKQDHDYMATNKMLFRFQVPRSSKFKVLQWHMLITEEFSECGTSMKRHDWENRTVLSYHKVIFWKLFQFYVTQFFFKFNRFVTVSENVKAPYEISMKFRCFLLVVTWFFDFFQISEVHPKPYTGRHIRAKFGVNRSGDSFN